MISREEVVNLSKLSKLSLSAEELPKLEVDLNNILNYVSELKNAKAGDVPTNVNRGLPSVESHLAVNVMREDANPHESGKFSEALIAAFPESQDGRLKVKKIL